MKCPKCGYHNTKRGPIQKLNDAEIMKLRGNGWTLREIARQLGVTAGGIAYAIKRAKKKK